MPLVLTSALSENVFYLSGPKSVLSEVFAPLSALELPALEDVPVFRGAAIDSFLSGALFMVEYPLFRVTAVIFDFKFWFPRRLLFGSLWLIYLLIAF